MSQTILVTLPLGPFHYPDYSEYVRAWDEKIGMSGVVHMQCHGNQYRPGQCHFLRIMVHSIIPQKFTRYILSSRMTTSSETPCWCWNLMIWRSRELWQLCVPNTAAPFFQYWVESSALHNLLTTVSDLCAIKTSYLQYRRYIIISQSSINMLL